MKRWLTLNYITWSRAQAPRPRLARYFLRFPSRASHHDLSLDLAILQPESLFINTCPSLPFSNLPTMSGWTESLSHLIQLSDGFVKIVLDRMNDESTLITELVKQANKNLTFWGNTPEEGRIVGNDATRMDSHKVLVQMLDNAPTDRGKRYAAVICCNRRDIMLVMLAYHWVNFLLWPCTSESSLLLPHSLFTCSKSAYKSKPPIVSPDSTPETQSSMTFMNAQRMYSFLVLVCFLPDLRN